MIWSLRTSLSLVSELGARVGCAHANLMMEPKPFSHHHLEFPRDQIRLLYVLPAREASDIHPHSNFLGYEFELRVVNLREAPAFIALSYAWGSKKPPRHVWVKNSPKDRPSSLPITENLSQALPELINTVGSLPMWIDAVCIDQERTSEKNQQVALMSTIFGSAQSVFVWLGPDEDGGASALEALDRVGEATWQQPALFYQQGRYWIARFAKSPVTYNPPVTHEILESLLSRYPVDDSSNAAIPYEKTRILLERSWWSRIWVLQEIASPILNEPYDPEMQGGSVIFACGSSRSNLKHVAAALTLVRLSDIAKSGYLHMAHDFFVPPWLNCRAFDMISVRVWMNRVPLLHLLSALTGFEVPRERLEATDPRDRVFALLNICSDSKELGIVPDYTKTPAEVYTEAAATMIRSQGLEIVLFTHFPKLLKDVPTWVPDWSAESTGYGMCLLNKKVEYGVYQFFCDIEPPFHPIPRGFHIEKNTYFKCRGHLLCARGLEVAQVFRTVDRHEQEALLTEIAKAQDDALIPAPRAIFHMDYEHPVSKEQGEEYVRERRYRVAFPKPPIKADSSTNRDILKMLKSATEGAGCFGPYSYVSLYKTDKKVKVFNLIVQMQSMLRTALPLARSGYETPSAYEDAIWRVVVADRE